MNICLIVDISGKVPYYDHALCTAIEHEKPDTITLATPFNQSIYSPDYNVKRLLRFTNKKTRVSKILKAIEGILNYIYLLFDILFNKYHVVHFQWLPFLEYIGFEKFFLALYRIASPKTKFILTQHNTFPHDSTTQQKRHYRNRFSQVVRYFDKLVVHTSSSKNSLCKEFGVSNEKIVVIYHGIFVPNIIPLNKVNGDKKKILMFGIQSYYKGTDILVDAISEIPKDIRDCIQVTIAGKTDATLLQEKYNLATSLGIRWESRFFEDDELNMLIATSDILVFPYRSISQSGALLLALAFGKPMIVSKLPSFMETLEGFPDNAFVEPESVCSLRDAIINYVNGELSVADEIKVIYRLQQKYSWKISASKTLDLYNL